MLVQSITSVFNPSAGLHVVWTGPGPFCAKPHAICSQIRRSFLDDLKLGANCQSIFLSEIWSALTDIYSFISDTIYLKDKLSSSKDAQNSYAVGVVEIHVAPHYNSPYASYRSIWSEFIWTHYPPPPFSTNSSMSRVVSNFLWTFEAFKFIVVF